MSSFVGDLAGNAVSDQLEGLPIGMGLDKYTNPSDDVRHYIGKYVSGAVDKVSSGVAERFASTSVEIMYDAERNSLHGQDLLKGIDVGERYKGVLDLEKMGLDFATGGTKEVVSSHITEHTLDPDTGLTPILQAKLGYETNPETGFTAVVQDSLAHIVDEDEFDEILAGMEERNPSTGANAAFGADATGSSTGLSGVDGRNLSTGASESPTTAGNPSLSEALSDDKLFENNRPGEYTYQSSQFGKTASGSLDLTDNPQRDSAAQRAAGGADREAMDDGGHLIGARFKGASGSENLEAQNRDVNRGDYKRMENRWAEDLNEGNQVYVHVETYRPEGSERPEAYMGYSITENKDGTREWDVFSYENLSHAEQEEFERIISVYDD